MRGEEAQRGPRPRSRDRAEDTKVIDRRYWKSATASGGDLFVLFMLAPKVGNAIAAFYHRAEHVEHHLFPAVQSRNLTKLREAIDQPIPVRKNVIACWREIYAIAKYREEHPDAVYVPEGYA